MQQPSSSNTHRSHDPLPEAREVAPSIWKICVPISFPLRHVNMYALIGKRGWALVDTGIGIPEARAAFTAGLQRAGLSIANLQAIVLTHLHPDHVGLSGELHEQSNASVYMHPIDEAIMQINWSGKLPERFGNVTHFFAQHGMPGTELWYSKADSQAMRQIVRVPPHEAITPIEDGESLELADERYRIIWTPGHSDGQVCLFRERDGVFLSADHILPRITPNIGLYWLQGRLNPLADYLTSLEKVSHLPASIVLPGHGEPLTDLAGRAAEIIAHHDERLGQMLTLIKERPQHAYAITEQIFGQRLKSDEARRMAMAEILAHLEYLRMQGKLIQKHANDDLILYALA